MIAAFPVTPFAIVLFLAFLALLVVLALVAGRATRAPEDGRRGCAGGCGMFAVVLVLCSLAIGGFAALVVTLTAVTAIEHNPIESIEVIAPDAEHLERAGRHDEVGVLVRIHTDGDHVEAFEHVRGFLIRRCDLHERDFERVEVHGTPDGTRIDLVVPLHRHELEEIELELQAWGLELGRGVRIRLQEERGG